MGPPWPLFNLSFLFKQTLKFFTLIHVKNFHPVYGAGIQTHNFQNMTSRLPEPLDQGSRQKESFKWHNLCSNMAENGRTTLVMSHQRKNQDAVMKSV